MNNYELDAFGRIGRHVSELDVGARINAAESAALTGAGGAFACVRPSLPGMQAHVQPSAFPSHIMASFHGQVPPAPRVDPCAQLEGSGAQAGGEPGKTEPPKPEPKRRGGRKKEPQPGQVHEVVHVSGAVGGWVFVKQQVCRQRAS